MSGFVFVGAAFLGVMTASAVEADSYPLLSFRLTSSPLVKRDFFRQSCKVHGRHEGSLGDFWYGGGKPLCRIDVCRRDLAEFERMRPVIEGAGMSLSFQQGLTTGHDYRYVRAPDAQAAAEAYAVYDADDAEVFPDDAWMVRPNGEVAKGMCLCPRSPAVLDYEYRYVKAVLEEIHPKTYWLDDDLRLGVGKVGCFCPRCLAAFNVQVKGAFSRESLVARIFEGRELDALRLEWIRFNEESLAIYGRAVRKAADEVMPACRLSLQTVGADFLLNGRDYGPVLRALSADGRVPAGIRPGHGCYREDRPLDFLEKAFWCTRESERCRRLGNACGTVCYEEETYTRRVLHKSPGAIVTECALALASGCDTLSLYWADGESPERVEDYERFVKAVDMARRYFECLSASTKRTSLGGVARYLGAHAFELKGFSLSDKSDLALMRAGIPVTVSEATAAHKVWLLSEKSLAAMDEEEKARIRKEGALEIPPEPTPLVSMRTKWLDEIDRITGGRFPVRIDMPHALRVLPRMRTDGTVDSVTLLNLSIGDAEELKVRVRCPAGKSAVWMDAKGGDAKPLVQHQGDQPYETVIVVPNLPGWQIGTAFFQ